jgi:hypothetical protein
LHVVRQSFRIGLRLGLLIGIGFALYRTLQKQRGARTPAPEPWQPIVDTPRPRPEPPRAPEPPPARKPEPTIDLRMPDVPTPAAAAPAPAPATPAPPERPVDEVGEPIDGPAPTVADDDAHPLDIEPPAVAPVKKAAKKVAKAAKKAAKAAKKEAAAKAAPPPPPPPPPPPAAPPPPGPPPAAEVTEPEPELAAAPVVEAAKSAVKKAAKKAAKKVAEVASDVAAAWIPPQDLTCPESHPVKARVASKLFHVPGSPAYERTRPDRCYLNAAAAQADGFSRSRR